MLPSKERLKRSILFTKAYKERKAVNTPFFTMYVLPRTRRAKSIKESKGIDQDKLVQASMFPMTGFVVSKKTNKSACLRNKMKRRIRESYRLLRNKSVNQWYVMILVIKESALNAPWPNLYRTMEDALVEAARKYGVND